jgi:hypothetical protein
MAQERFPWHAAFTAFPVFSFVRPLCVFICISDCIEIVYELLLLPNNTASETFLQKSEAVQRVDWIFIITGVPA